MISIWVWVGFLLFIFAMLTLDLGVFTKRNQIISPRKAVLLSSFWIFLALVFNVLVYFLYKHNIFGLGLDPAHALSSDQAALQFFTGYLIEESLSLDNLFVIAVIFNYFAVPPQYQHRVLYWGIVGAIVMRGIMIAVGVIVLQKFFWVDYILGAILILTAAKMLMSKDSSIEPNKNPLVKIARKFFPVTADFEHEKFFIKRSDQWYATPLFLVLLVVESSDLIFAVDSIPAVFAITRDPFIVFTSNVFAILGLRSLYFLIAAMLTRFRYLKVSLVFVLGFVGTKMLLHHHFPIPTVASLLTICSLLAVGILASVLAARRTEKQRG